MKSERKIIDLRDPHFGESLRTHRTVYEGGGYRRLRVEQVYGFMNARIPDQMTSILELHDRKGNLHLTLMADQNTRLQTILRAAHEAWESVNEYGVYYRIASPRFTSTTHGDDPKNGVMELTDIELSEYILAEKS
jgi:hypothetical protein